MKKKTKQRLWFVARILDTLMCIFSFVVFTKMFSFIFVSCVMVWVILLFLFHDNAKLVDGLVKVTGHLPKLIIAFWIAITYVILRYVIKWRGMNGRNKRRT